MYRSNFHTRTYVKNWFSFLHEYTYSRKPHPFPPFTFLIVFICSRLLTSINTVSGDTFLPFKIKIVREKKFADSRINATNRKHRNLNKHLWINKAHAGNVGRYFRINMNGFLAKDAVINFFSSWVYLQGTIKTKILTGRLKFWWKNSLFFPAHAD